MILLLSTCQDSSKIVGRCFSGKLNVLCNDYYNYLSDNYRSREHNRVCFVVFLSSETCYREVPEQHHSNKSRTGSI